MSSKLYDLRNAARTLLLQDGLWEEGEVLIKRRSKIWNDIAVATETSKTGQCVVIGVASGKPAKGTKDGSSQLYLELTIPFTLFETPNMDDGDSPDEDLQWEETVLRLQGSALGRSALHYSLDFESFEEVEDEQYVVRQTIFKTNFTLKP